MGARLVIYVVTSILEGFDNLRPPAIPAETFCKFICFTNVPNLPRVTPWEYRPAYMAGKLCRSSRVPKILPHLMLPADAEYSIWHDGNFQLRKDPQTVINQLLSNHDWAAHRHPCRNCIYEEAKEVLNGCPLTNKEEVTRQIEKYHASNFPANAGLWANGFIVRRHTPAVARLNAMWWEEFRDGSERDQLSFPVALRNSGMDIRTINENVFVSSWILSRRHAAFKELEDNSDYWPERMEIHGRLAELARLTGSDSCSKYGVSRDASGAEFFNFQ